VVMEQRALMIWTYVTSGASTYLNIQRIDIDLLYLG
jgi:hypothetical protein